MDQDANQGANARHLSTSTKTLQPLLLVGFCVAAGMLYVLFSPKLGPAERVPTLAAVIVAITINSWRPSWAIGAGLWMMTLAAWEPLMGAAVSTVFLALLRVCYTDREWLGPILISAVMVGADAAWIAVYKIGLPSYWTGLVVLVMSSGGLLLVGRRFIHASKVSTNSVYASASFLFGTASGVGSAGLFVRSMSHDALPEFAAFISEARPLWVFVVFGLVGSAMWLARTSSRSSVVLLICAVVSGVVLYGACYLGHLERYSLASGGWIVACAPALLAQVLRLKEKGRSGLAWGYAGCLAGAALYFEAVPLP